MYEVRVIVQDWIEDHMLEEKGVGLLLLLEWDGAKNYDVVEEPEEEDE